MKIKSKFTPESVFGFNTEGKRHLLAIEHIQWLSVVKRGIELDFDIAKDREVNSGYEFDETIERIRAEAQLDLINHIINHFESRED